MRCGRATSRWPRQFAANKWGSRWLVDEVGLVEHNHIHWRYPLAICHNLNCSCSEARIPRQRRDAVMLSRATDRGCRRQVRDPRFRQDRRSTRLQRQNSGHASPIGSCRSAVPRPCRPRRDLYVLARALALVPAWARALVLVLVLDLVLDLVRGLTAREAQQRLCP